MLTYDVESFRYDKKVKSCKGFRLFSDSALSDERARELVKMPFSKAVEIAKVELVGQPSKSDLTQVSQKDGSPERLNTTSNEVEKCNFILDEAQRLLPELKKGVSTLQSRFNSSVESAESDEDKLRVSNDLLSSLSSAGSDHKLLGIIVSAAKKNFASVDSMPFDTFGKSLTPVEWADLQKTRRDLKEQFAKPRKEMSSSDYLKNTSPAKAKKDQKDLEREIRALRTPLY